MNIFMAFYMRFFYVLCVSQQSATKEFGSSISGSATKGFCNPLAINIQQCPTNRKELAGKKRCKPAHHVMPKPTREIIGTDRLCI